MQSTYVPAEPASYSPPKPEQHAQEQADNPFTGSLAGAQPAAVVPPAVGPNSAPHTLEFQGKRTSPDLLSIL